MKRLKFRAWDNVNNKIISDIYPAANGDIAAERSGVFRLILPCERVIVEQWTGCVDINGTEIYEGDIIRIEDNTNGIDEVVEIAEVCFIDYCWMLKYIESIAIINPDYFNEFADTNYYKLEVIGNKHEYNT